MLLFIVETLTSSTMLTGEKPNSLRMAMKANKRKDQATLLGLLVVVFALAAVLLYNLWTTRLFCSEIEQLSGELRSLQRKTDTLRNAYRDLKNLTGERFTTLEETIENLESQSNEGELLKLNNSSATTTQSVSNKDEDRFDVIQQGIEKIKREHKALGVKINSKVDVNATNAMVESIDALSKALQKTQSKVDSLQSFADNTYKGLTSLGGQFNEHVKQPHQAGVNLEELCSVQREQCTVPSSRQGGYWKSCRTPRTALNNANKITLFQGCSFRPHSRFSEYQESLTLQEGDGDVWCDCDVTFPGEDGDKQRSITGDFNGTCYLTILRCDTQS